MAMLENLIQSPTPVLWLDATAYAERLLGGGSVPWSDTTAALAWYGKLSGLLRPDIVSVPLVNLVQHLLLKRPALKDAMRARSRALFPVRTLLADEGLRGLAKEICTGVARTSGNHPVVLTLPTPGALTRFAYQAAHGGTTEDVFEPEDFEDAAAYVADFLREMAETGIAGITLVADASEAGLGMDAASAFRPVINVAQHYRWKTGVLLPPDVAPSGDAPSGVDYAIANSAVGDLPTFIWNSTGGEPLRGWVIPENAEPEGVLAHLEELRKP